ncbi:MAG: hypothetical protein ACOCW1_05255 [Chitinispirillaceae bacterium]
MAADESEEKKVLDTGKSKHGKGGEVSCWYFGDRWSGSLPAVDGSM